jgi:hypothetical protein
MPSKIRVGWQWKGQFHTGTAAWTQYKKWCGALALNSARLVRERDKLFSQETELLPLWRRALLARNFSKEIAAGDIWCVAREKLGIHWVESRFLTSLHLVGRHPIQRNQPRALRAAPAAAQQANRARPRPRRLVAGHEAPQVAAYEPGIFRRGGNNPPREQQRGGIIMPGLR